MIRTNLRRDELKKLNEIAQRGGRSRSGLISYTLRKLIEAEQQQEAQS